MRRVVVSALLVGALSSPALAQTSGSDSGGLLQMLFSGAAREPAVERPYQPVPQYPSYPAGYQPAAAPQPSYAPAQPQVIYQPAPAPQVVYRPAPVQQQVMYQPVPAPQAVYQPTPVQQQVMYQPAPAPRAFYQPAPVTQQVVYQPVPAPQPAYEPNYAAIPMPQVGYQPLPPPPPVPLQPGYVAVPLSPQGQPLMAYAPAAQGDPAHMPIDPQFERQAVEYKTDEKPGTIVIDTPHHFLYLVEADGRALRYGIGVGRPGFTWEGVKTVTAKKEWPDWIPPADMLQRRPDLPRFMPGGPDNPLGARAMYLGSTLYRIHGSNEPWTIGTDVSSGCIRLRNADVIDLYDRVKVGAKVVVM